jgi:hydrogenase maturation protease
MVEPATAHRSPPALGDAETRRLLILGLGNPMMADDGVGHEVVCRLEGCDLPKSVRVFAIDGDVLALGEIWEGEEEVWIVDAVSSQHPAGTVHVYGHQDVLSLPVGTRSAHHPSVSESLRWILHSSSDMTATEFRLFGIEAGVVRPERGLSRPVENSITHLVGKIERAARRLISSSSADLKPCGENPNSPGIQRAHREHSQTCKS